MSLHKRTLICLMCVLALAHAAQPFQQNDPAKDLVIRVNVGLVQVDATVTNSNDEPVADLHAEDFIILQDDKPQEITNFSLIRIRDPKPAVPVQKPKLQVQFRLFHEGREVYSRKPFEMTIAAKGNSKRMIAADQLKLKQLPSGYNVLQIAVTDMLADSKDQMAVQSIDFEAQGATSRRATAF
jgi:hypothetical protein